MTSKRRQRSKSHVQQSVEAARLAAVEAANLPGDELELDPASQLFYEYAAPLLATARNDDEFNAAANIAEFVWFSSSFDTQTQAEMLAEFIQESGIPNEMVPWLLEVYEELVERKDALIG
jgi:hypothetical protein